MTEDFPERNHFINMFFSFWKKYKFISIGGALRIAVISLAPRDDNNGVMLFSQQFNTDGYKRYILCCMVLAMSMIDADKSLKRHSL